MTPHQPAEPQESSAPAAPAPAIEQMSAPEPASIPGVQPKLPPFFFRWLTYLLLLPLIGVATAFFGSISLLCGLWDRSGRQQHFIAHLWARTLLLLSLSSVQIIGRENLRPGEAAVYASNHLSYMDTPVLFSHLPFQFRILAKQALWKIPFIGWYLNRSGQVPIDQSTARNAVASLNRGISTLRGGMPMVIFPEGGRAATGRLQPFVSGAAYMAIKAQVPVIPITLIGTYELLPIHVYALHPRPLAVVVGTPISTIGLTSRDADAVTQKMFQVIHDTYIGYSR